MSAHSTMARRVIRAVVHDCDLTPERVMDLFELTEDELDEILAERDEDTPRRRPPERDWWNA